MTSSGQLTRHAIGAALRAERERRHISLDAVARGTLVRHDFLQLIDEEHFEALPSGAYAKGFIRAYATYLGLDWRPFARAYEERYAQPAPELSRVVRRGVRVPPAAQRRGWQIAVVGTATVIILLALLGAFRSGEEPASVPQVSVTAARAARASENAPNPMGAIVQVKIVGQASWIEAEADGQTIFSRVLRAGETRTFKGKDEVVLTLARAREVRIIANGRILGSPAEPSYRGVFRPETEQLPANEPASPSTPDNQTPGSEPAASKPAP